MTSKEKLIGLAALVWWLTSGSSSKKSATKTPASPGKKGSVAEPGRPEEAKPDPSDPVDLTPERAPEPKPKAKPKDKEDGTEPTKEAKKKAARKAVPKGQQEDAQEFAKGFYQAYLDRGIEKPQAAAEGLSLYMMAGGQDPEVIKAWQQAMGVTPSGEYDKETSTAIASQLDMAVDGAINGLINGIFGGERPDVVAGNMLLQYIKEGREIETVIPREKIAALQMLMGVQPVTGKLDDATINKLVELGITPTESE